MTVVSSKDFVRNEDKYFDLALEEQVCIQKGDNMFLLLYKNVDDKNIYHDASVYEEILEPDDDLRRAITAEELLERIHEDIHRKFALYRE
jgi:hypothetical protein